MGEEGGAPTQGACAEGMHPPTVLITYLRLVAERMRARARGLGMDGNRGGASLHLCKHAEPTASSSWGTVPPACRNKGGMAPTSSSASRAFTPSSPNLQGVWAWRGGHGWPLGLGPWVGGASLVDTQPSTRLPTTSLTQRGVPLVAANPPTQHAAMLVGLVDPAPPSPAPARVALHLVGLLKA